MHKRIFALRPFAPHRLPSPPLRRTRHSASIARRILKHAWRAQHGYILHTAKSGPQQLRYCPQNVCKLQSSYICGEIKNQIKNNEAYNGTKIGNYFRNGLIRSQL